MVVVRLKLLVIFAAFIRSSCLQEWKGYLEYSKALSNQTKGSTKGSRYPISSELLHIYLHLA